MNNQSCDNQGCSNPVPDGGARIKDLTMGDLVKSDSPDSYTVIRNGHDLGVFIKLGRTYHFRDNQNNTWVCVCSNIDTGAESIEDAIKFMNY